MTRRPANWLSAETQQLTACHAACLERGYPRDCRRYPVGLEPVRPAVLGTVAVRAVVTWRRNPMGDCLTTMGALLIGSSPNLPIACTCHFELLPNRLAGDLRSSLLRRGDDTHTSSEWRSVGNTSLEACDINVLIRPVASATRRRMTPTITSDSFNAFDSPSRLGGLTRYSRLQE